ncbi:MAG: HDOD domain-containing protein [Proteobacteria bacterium]|nr:HDOD domain-containing protein [Pseudomonadota bacterium]
MTAEEVLELIGRKDSLPVLPQLFYRIVEVASIPETPVSELSRLILEDQVLTGRVIRMANSAYYATEEKISSVTRAIMVLGFITLKSFITAITVGDSLNKEAFKGRFFDAFWIHGLACSLSANFLAQRLKCEHPEEAMIAGLVHDSGKLFLDHHFPKAYTKVVEMTKKGEDILRAEGKVFGLTHVDVGEKIARRWCLPESLVDGVRDHHQFSESLDNLRLSDIVYLANLFAFQAVPEEWADRIQWMNPGNSADKRRKKICLELGL